MNLSTQLRIILLLAGAIIWLAIYWWGRRKVASPRAAAVAPESPLGSSMADTSALFETSDPLLEDELDTPAYMRRAAIREPRQDYEPRIADANDFDASDFDASDFDDIEEAHEPAPRIVRNELNEVRNETTDFEVGLSAPRRADELLVEPIYVEPTYIEPEAIHILSEAQPAPLDALRDDEFHAPPAPRIKREPESTMNIPVMAEPVATGRQSYVRERSAPLLTAAPTLSQSVPVTNSRAASTDTSTKMNTARRKIIALRLPMATRVLGAQLLSLLQAEQLQHGKFNIFHRMHETAADSGTHSATVFSVASMVEPGSFDLTHMAEQEFPGVTLFMLLPGPLDGLVAYDQMLSCAQRLAHATGAELHDERGVKLNAQSMARLREEVLDFQHLIGGAVSH